METNLASRFNVYDFLKFFEVMERTDFHELPPSCHNRATYHPGRAEDFLHGTRENECGAGFTYYDPLLGRKISPAVAKSDAAGARVVPDDVPKSASMLV